jgi:hypothetical protein
MVNKSNKRHKENDVTVRSCSVISFWVIIGVLFIFSYKALTKQSYTSNANGESGNENQEATVGQQIITPDSLSAIEGVDLVLKGFAVANDLQGDVETQLELITNSGSLRRIGSGQTSQKSIVLRGSVDKLKGQLLANDILFRGYSNAQLTIKWLSKEKIVPIIVQPTKDVVQQEVSLLIKTYERPASLSLLIDSIRQFYSDIPILVADDSKNPSFKTSHNIQYYPLEYDLGLSASRNYLLDKVCKLTLHCAYVVG